MDVYTIKSRSPYAEVDEKVFKDILTIAYEGGMEWARCLRPERDEDLNIETLVIVGDDEDRFLEPVCLAPGDIAAGCQLYIEHAHPDNADALFAELVDWDNRGGCFLDAVVADCIVQYAAFGEVVYG